MTHVNRARRALVAGAGFFLLSLLSSSGAAAAQAHHTAATTAPAYAVGANARCPAPLRDRNWPAVHARAASYIGCRVDIAGQVVDAETYDGYAEYTIHLNPDTTVDQVVFARYDSTHLPRLSGRPWVRLRGAIDASTQAVDPATGKVLDHVARVAVTSIARITKAQATGMGANGGMSQLLSLHHNLDGRSARSCALEQASASIIA